MKRVSRRLVSVAGGIALLVPTSILVAPGSSADVTHEVTITCQAPTTIYGAVGDTFVFTMAETCTTAWEFYNTMDYGSNPTVPGLLSLVSRVNYSWATPPDRPDWAVYSDGSGTTQITATLLADNSGFPLPEGWAPMGEATLTIGRRVAEVDDDSGEPPFPMFEIIYGGLNPPSSAGSDVNAPLPVHQAVGMPSSASCADVDDRDLNWGGSSSGGWKPSWQAWMNGGAGGAVCQRELRYAGNGRWDVGP